jgi:hypothetical protein
VAKKILALVSEPVSTDALRSALGASTDDAEVMVVAPALDSRTRFWTSDSDEAIARAAEVQEETVKRLADDDVDAVGDTGEADPLLAIHDALATFPADEVLIFTRPKGDRNWAEGDLLDQAREQLSVPVRHMEVHPE